MQDNAVNKIEGCESGADIRAKVSTGLILAILVLSESFFGLIDVSAFNIAGVVNIDLFWQVLLLCFSIGLYISSLKVPCEKVSIVEGALLVLLVLACLTAALRCGQLTGQPFIRGILPQRGFIVACLSAACLRRPVRAGLLDVELLVKGIIVLGCFASGLFLLQALLGSSVKIIYYLTGARYGGLRVYVDSAISTTAGILSFWILVRVSKIRYCIPSLLALSVILFVSKGRLELIVYISVLLFILVVERATARTKTMLICFAALTLLAMLQSPYFSHISESFINGRVGGSEDTSSIRKAGREWYDKALSSYDHAEILGCGYPSSLYPVATEMAGFNHSIFLVDNGIWAFRYVYGDLGLFIVALFSLQLIVRVIKTRPGGLTVPLIAYVMFLLLPMQNLAWWWWTADWQVMTAIFIALTWLDPSIVVASGSIDVDD